MEQAFKRVWTLVNDEVTSETNRQKILDAAKKNPTGHVVIAKTNGTRFTFELRKTDPVDVANLEPSLKTMSLRHVAWVGRTEPELAELGRDPRILSVAAQALGLDDLKREGHAHITQMINQAHYKEPNDGVGFPWHQDSQHRRLPFGDFVDVNGRGSYVQVLIAVEDTTPESGPVKFIPGSGIGGHIGGKEGLRQEDVPAAKAVTPLPKRGDAILLNPFTIHGSEGNTSSSWRRLFVNGYAYPGAQRARNTVVCEEVPLPAEWLA